MGFPLTEEVNEINPGDGTQYTVQYLERARFEYHPEFKGTKYETELGLLGRQVTAGREAEKPFQTVGFFPDRGDARFYAPTGHSLAGGFMYFWDQNGGLDVFGYPISEEFDEVNPTDGKTYTVQYFERARFEYHPEFAGTPFETELGQLGREILAKKGGVLTSPGITLWWEAEDALDHNFTSAFVNEALSESLALFAWSETSPDPGGYRAVYKVRVPVSAQYHLWSHELSLAKASSSLWRFDNGPWQRTGGEAPELDVQSVAQGMDFAWQDYGQYFLPAGLHTLELMADQYAPGAGAYIKGLDAFVLTSEAFNPSGRMKPAGTAEGQALTDSVNLDVDAGAVTGPWRHLERDFGQGGESTDPDYLANAIPRMQALQTRLVRIDHLYDYYNVVSRRGDGSLAYDWSSLDRAVDTIYAMGAQPFMSLTYMPTAISRSGSINDPPGNYGEWQEVVRATVYHFNVERGLGIKYWEVWNEPNLGNSWFGTMEEYFNLYDAAVAGALEADPSIKIGGPGTISHEGWVPAFIQHVASRQIRADFLSWHIYNIKPPMVRNQIKLMRSLLQSNGLGAMELIVSEWNISSFWGPDQNGNKVMDNNVGATYVAGTLNTMTEAGLDKALLFEVKDGVNAAGEVFYGRYGLLTYTGLAKPSYNVVMSYSQLGDTQLSSHSDDPRIGIVATRQGGRVALLIWYMATPGQGPQDVQLNVRNIGGSGMVSYERYLIDATHSNSSLDPSHQEVEQVESGQVSGQSWQTNLNLTTNSVTLILLNQ